MAITDLRVGLSAFTHGIVASYHRFSNDSIFCQISDFLDMWMSVASLAHVLAVNVERYLAIVFPLKYKYLASSTKVKLALIGLWSVTLVEAILFLLQFILDDYGRKKTKIAPALDFGTLIFACALPFITVLGLYTHMVVVITRKLHFQAANSKHG